VELLASPLEPNFWRPTTDNDYGANLQRDLACWKNAGGEAVLLGKPSLTQGPEAVEVAVEFAVGSGGAQLCVMYKVSERAVSVAAKWRPSTEKGAKLAISGGVVYLRAHSNRHLDVEGKRVQARWNDQGEWQGITLHAEGRAPGARLQHGDVVALQAVTGKTEAELLLHGIVPASGEAELLPDGLSAVAVEATGAPRQPVWTLQRAAGPGEVHSDDKIFLQAGDRRLAVVDGRVLALGGGDDPPPSAAFSLEIKDHPGPPRVGFQTVLAEGMEDVEWFGRGPHESYCDRYASTYVGRFRGSIADQTFKYVRPQENGNKHETRWMALKRSSASGAACAGLLVSARAPSVGLGMQCHRYALADFDGGDIKTAQPFLHGGELTQRAETALCIDAAQMGVGGIDSWGRKPLPQHMIKGDQHFDWTFELRPLGAQDLADDGALIATGP